MAAPRAPQAGFSLMEMMVATAIMMGVTAAIFSMMNPAQGTYQAQPEASDLQQRMRIGVDVLTKDIIMAGAGTYMGSNAGALYNYFAPVMPYRSGDLNPDPASGVYYRSDTISLMYVPPTPAQTTVIKAEGNNSQELLVEPMYNCGIDKHDQLCGFHENQHVLVYDTDGSWDMTTITNVQDPAAHLQHSGKLSSQYNSGNAQITEVATHTYYLKNDATSRTYQLMHYDGGQTDLPVVDNVIKLEFAYFGDPLPPMLVPGKSLCNADEKGPFTTYGPKPPCLSKDGTGGYLQGENCAFKVVNGVQVPRMDTLASGYGQVELTQAMLTDGPWCPGQDVTNYPNRFDADLLRIRRIRVTMRVQAALSALRGPAGMLFTHGGTATSPERLVPDQEIQFSVTPRNMTLGR
jgi:prepilin-type N-terminal cleavage/methylation domain-containing protein